MLYKLRRKRKAKLILLLTWTCSDLSKKKSTAEIFPFPSFSREFWGDHVGYFTVQTRGKTVQNWNSSRNWWLSCWFVVLSVNGAPFLYPLSSASKDLLQPVAVLGVTWGILPPKRRRCGRLKLILKVVTQLIGIAVKATLNHHTVSLCSWILGGR